MNENTSKIRYAIRWLTVELTLSKLLSTFRRKKLKDWLLRSLR